MPFSGHHEKQTKPQTSHYVLSEFIWSEQVNINAKDRGHRRWCLCRWVRVTGRNVDRAQRASSCSSPGRWDETSARLWRTGWWRTDETDIMGRITSNMQNRLEGFAYKGEGESCSHLDVAWWGLGLGWGNKNGKKGDCVYRDFKGNQLDLRSYCICVHVFISWILIVAYYVPDGVLSAEHRAMSRTKFLF